jgi:hypothetical protein
LPFHLLSDLSQVNAGAVCYDGSQRHISSGGQYQHLDFVALES